MKTSEQWWEEIKKDPDGFTAWLQKQYRGEVTAAVRIQEVASLAESTMHTNVLMKIADQESNHAKWIGELLIARGINPKTDYLNAEKRYWAVTKPAIKDFPTAMAVGAHAEKMRLERIQTIAFDEDAPSDVRDVFTRILAEELWHERAFREMAGAEAMASTKANADEGRRVLGLVA